jgi:hypothetical protein
VIRFGLWKALLLFETIPIDGGTPDNKNDKESRTIGTQRR